MPSRHLLPLAAAMAAACVGPVGGTAPTPGTSEAGPAGASSDGGEPRGGGGLGAADAVGDDGHAGRGTAAPDDDAHVQIADGALLVDGEPTFLFGGDLHYFRVRAPEGDVEETYAMWEETLDAMAEAGMNLVTTYVPWDYHNPAPGEYDFEGARDVGRFVDMACDRGFYVVYKPGPLITAEWPRGFGTFGAVPAWWKEAHPEALIRDASGDLFTYSPTGAEDQRQPTYLHPAYLEAVREWYGRAMEPVRHHLGGCLVGVQVDNETNMYWSDRYGAVDYSETAVAHYRRWLAGRYGSIDALNARYGTRYETFDAVDPPRSAPATDLDERPRNPWYADWYWAGQAYVAEYLRTLRAMLSELGFDEPDVLFTTNDSPFTLLYEDLQLRNVLLHDGPTKNEVGLATLDLYPRQFPTSSALQDQPFQADYFTELFDHYGDLYTGPQPYAFAAELQAGFYALPLLGQPEVRPEATDQLLARAIGRGLRGGSLYVIRDGLNADGSAYDYQAPIGQEGQRTARYDVVARWGRFLQREGQALLRSREVRDRVAILRNGRYAPPQGGIHENIQRLATIEEPALYGWLASASLSPAVLDSRLVDLPRLLDNDVVFYPNPDFVDDDTAVLLADYVAAGGVLVELLYPGRVNEDFVATAASEALSEELFPAEEEGSWVWVNPARSGRINVRLPGGRREAPLSFWYVSFWDPPGDAEPFAWERGLFGGDGAVVGYVMRDGLGARAFLGTNVWSRFNSDRYYDWNEEDVERAVALALWLASLGGVSPALSTGGVRQLAWARRTDDALYVFVVNDGSSAARVRVTVHDLARLGLLSDVTYRFHDVLADRPLGSASGASLAASGLEAPLPAYGTAVVRISRDLE